MKNMQLILGCLIIAALLAPLAAMAAKTVQLPNLGSLRSVKRALGLHHGHMQINAFADGIHHDGIITRRVDAAHSYRHLLVKTGSDADHSALCGAGDLPLGVCIDTPAVAEDPAAMKLLGSCEGTVLMVGSEAIAADVDVYTAANGTVQDEPAVAGTYYLIGRSVTACAAANKEFEVVPCIPVKVVVVAALTSTNGTAAGAADLAALKAEAEKIGDDVRAIAAALATPARVKVLAA